MSDNPEWIVRKQRVDPILDALGWPRSMSLGESGTYRLEEFETTNGPADYALCVDGRVLGIIEAKKLTLGPQNVLTQAERYSRGANSNPLNFDGYRVPFLYSTNGEVIWFRDARHPLNRSRRVVKFHTPAALVEMMGRNLDADIAKLKALPNPSSQPDERSALPFRLSHRLPQSGVDNHRPNLDATGRHSRCCLV